MNNYLYIDLETTGLNPLKDQIHGIATMEYADDSDYYAVDTFPKVYKDHLANPEKVVVIHSGRRFDLKFLICAGFEVNCKIVDTYHIFKAIDENQPLGLKPLTIKYLGPEYLQNKRELDKAIDEAGAKNLAAFCRMDLKDPEHPYFNTIAKYAVEDVENTFALFHAGKARHKEIKQNIQKVFGSDAKAPIDHLRDFVFPLEQVLLSIDKRGVKADMNLIHKIRDEKVALRDSIARKLYLTNKKYVNDWENAAYAKVYAEKKRQADKDNVQCRNKKQKTLFNWGSGKHVGPLIYEHYDLPEELRFKSEKTGDYRFDKYARVDLKEALGKNHPAYATIDLYESYQKAKTIAGTYTGDNKKGMISKIHEGRMWTEYTQTTKTWRLASRTPNLQNLPRKGSTVQKFFIPDTKDHVFFVGDYSQIELMMAAHYSQDKVLLEEYQHGGDVHTKTMNLIGAKDRQVGKECNFLCIYRGSWKMLQITLKRKAGIELSDDEAKYYIQRYWEEYEGLNTYLLKVERDMRRYRMVRCAETGAVRRLPDLVYGEYLNWKEYKFTGSPELVQRAIDKINSKFKSKTENRGKTPPPPSQNQIFWQCYEFFRHAKKQGFNFVPQHMGMIVCGLSMMELHKRGDDIVNTVHDEIKIQLTREQAREHGPKIAAIMEKAYRISIPLRVDWQLQETFDKEDVVDNNS